MLTQFVDVGGLRFSADSFSTIAAGYQAAGGTVLIGFTPSSQGEDFRGLLDVDLDALGSAGDLEIDTTT